MEYLAAEPPPRVQGPGEPALGPRDTRALSALVARRAARAPGAVAIAAPDRPTLTYARLWEHVQHTGRRLNELGLGRGDRVAVVLPNGPEMATAFLSVASAATCAPLNPGYRQGEFEFSLEDLGASALIVPEGSDSPAVAAARARGVPVLGLTVEEGCAAGLFTLSGGGIGRGSPAEPSGPDDVALVLHTSGTTSRPKRVPLRQRHLVTSAEAVAASLRLSPADCCLNVMPLFHIHGLVGALLSSLAVGASVVCTPGFLAPRFLRWLAQFEATWYTAVPAMHQSILQRAAADPGAARSAPLRFVRSCSSPLPPRVMADLEAAFGVPVVEAYGMTEAAHQIASNPLPPRARKPGSVGLAVGVELATMGEHGRLLAPGETGEVVIRGESVMDGYEGDPQVNGTAFAHGWFRTGDLGYLDADGYLFLTGRLKEIINRGGEKIAPREVDEALLEHPAVAQATAFALPDPQLGEEVAAAVVLREGASVTQQELQQLALQRLADFKVPRRILFVPEIPKGPTGKPQRIGLAERLGLVPPPGESATPARRPPPISGGPAAAPTPLERVLAAIWAEVLEADEPGIHDSFLEIGGDSLMVTRVAARVSDIFRVDLPVTAFFERPTIAGIAALLAGDPDTGARVGRAAELLVRMAELAVEGAAETEERR